MGSQTISRIGTRQWNVDPSHTQVGFSVRHMMIARVRGRFNTVNGEATFDPDNIESGSVKVEIDTSSIDTRDDRRDGHLRSADFFDAEMYPVIRFTSRDITPTGNRSYHITGDLTVRDTTREVTLDAEFTDVVADPFGGFRVGVTARTAIDRTEFGLNWNQALEAGGVLVGERIDIEIDAELIAN